MPSFVPVGGIRMSVRTASGVSSSTAASSSSRVVGGADELDLIGGGQERGCSLADQVVILGEHHADHARMVHGGLEETGYAA